MCSRSVPCACTIINTFMVGSLVHSIHSREQALFEGMRFGTGKMAVMKMHP